MGKVVVYSLKDNFIDKLCAFIDENYVKKGVDPGRVAVVFEGKRPALFLKKKLSAKIGKSFVPPAFFSIDEFVNFALKKKRLFSKMPNMDAWHLIYRLSKELAPEMLEKRAKFSEFMPWAREIASFMDLLDAEAVPSENLRGIEESAGIGYEVPESINRVLDRMISLREAYHDAFEKRREFSRGYIYRSLASCIGEVDLGEYDEILFCGFFRMQKTVLDVVKCLYESGKASVFLQGISERGQPLKCEMSPGSFHISRADPDAPRVRLHAAFDTHSQVCAVREILKERGNPESTVVVLPDAANMMPLVSELGEEFGDFNISLGYPLKRSALCCLFELVVKAQKTRKGDKYYAKDYIAAISQPLAKNLGILPERRLTRVLVHKIEEALIAKEGSALGGTIFVGLDEIEAEDKIISSALETLGNMDIKVSPEELKDVVKGLNRVLFRLWEDIGSLRAFSGALGEFLDILVRKSALEKYPLNLKVAKRLYAIRDEFQRASFGDEEFDTSDIFRLFSNTIGHQMLAFSGSPLKGLQVLGLLETRCLNFDNVVIMDANDGCLPRLRRHHPLMPHEVTASIGLDMLEKEEAIQRYLFDRLIACAKNVDIVYEANTGKDRSRFVERLVWERQKREKDLDVLKPVNVGFAVETKQDARRIEKTDEMVEFLKGHRYSASSVNTYLQCPLRFYYNYVLRLEEKEEIAEDVEGREIGTFIHELLEKTFARFVGEKMVIDNEFRGYFFGEFEKKFGYTFRKKMRADSFLLEKVMRYRLEQFLKSEEERYVREILYLEKEFKEDLILPGGEYKFRYIVDRVDVLEDGSVLVLDYKTGLDAKMPKKTEKLLEMEFIRESVKDNVRSFQLPMYYYFEKKKHEDADVNAGLYSLRRPDIKKFISKGVNIEKTMEVCLQGLDFILHEITDPDVPFMPDRDEANGCRYCPFSSLCR